MPELASYAIHESGSRGRARSEPPPEIRTEFARDRDRIVHSAAFRRLEYKTQVFVNHEGDLFRTRLTHSLEVAQIARSIARALGVNEDLCEAISLAHDLGHTPFGHAGQEALNECMREFGGFEHNLQSLRIVDRLEERYGAFDGLNLMYETREGILKHCPKTEIENLGPLGERFLRGHRPSLEAQICNIADEIAYNNHDIDDGIRSGLIGVAALCSVEFFESYLHEAKRKYPYLGERRLVTETVRQMIGAQVVDLVTESRARIVASGISTPDEVRQAQALVSFGSSMKAAHAQLKRFLLNELYRHPRVSAMADRSATIVKELFAAFMDSPEHLPIQYQTPAETDKARTVADYIAGMTDRYAFREHERLYGANATNDLESFRAGVNPGY